MIGRPPRAEHERLLELAETGDVGGAFALLDDWLDQGWTASRILAEAVVPAQQEVGRRWQRNEWTVAKEHTATAVVDALVGVLGLRASRQVRGLRPEGAPVLVVCAEGEWHTLVARLVAEGLRAEGWPVQLLGGSVPASQLEPAAVETTWSAAVVCCAVPMFLPGAQRSVAALRRAGLPVLATGRGFGDDDRRAVAIGADGWAPDLAAGIEILTSWERRAPELRGAPVPPAEAMALAAAVPDVVAAACGELARRWPPFDQLGASAKARTREDVAYLLAFIEATLATGDERILTDYLDWLEVVLTTRSVPASVVPLTLRSVQQVLPTDLRGTHDALLAVMRRSPSA